MVSLKILALTLFLSLLRRIVVLTAENRSGDGMGCGGSRSAEVRLCGQLGPKERNDVARAGRRGKEKKEKKRSRKINGGEPAAVGHNIIVAGKGRLFNCEYSETQRR